MINDYRYGFNGKESDNEVNGVAGGSQDHGFRSYDARLGRYKSVDPLAKDYAWTSPYAYAENDVIRSIDLEGLEKYKVTGNTIIFSASFAIFTNRPEGGNVPNDKDIVNISKKNWKQLNDGMTTETYLLDIEYDDNGNVVNVTEGETPYTIQFDITVKTFKDENSEEYKKFKKSETFSGIYLLEIILNLTKNHSNL